MRESNAPTTQASTGTAQTSTYIEEDPYDNGTNKDDMYHMQARCYSYQTSSSYQVHRPKSLWQPYYMEAYENELETVDELQHVGELGMNPPYQFGTHRKDPLA